MSNVEEKVKDIIVEELGVEREKLTSDASFMEDLGADRLADRRHHRLRLRRGAIGERRPLPS